MSVAITLRLDDTTSSRVAALAEALPDRLHEIAGFRQSYPAHITLASYSDQIDVADLDAALATVTGSWRALSATLAGIAVLPGNRATISLLAIPTIDLLHRHAVLHRALADLPTHPAYQINAWMPVVSVSVTNFLSDSVEVLASAWRGPIVGWAISLDLIRLDPVEMLSARPLLD